MYNFWGKADLFFSFFLEGFSVSLGALLTEHIYNHPSSLPLLTQQPCYGLILMHWIKCHHL